LEEGSASVTPSSTNPYHCPAVRSSRLTWYGGETMPALLLVPFEDGDGIHQLLPASFKRMGGLHGMGSPRFAHAWWLRQLLGAPAWILVSVDIPWMILSHEVSHWVLRQYWRVEYGTRWTLPEFIDEGLAE